MKQRLLFLLGFFSLVVFGQNEKYFFKQEYLPNSEYEINFHTYTISKIPNPFDKSKSGKEVLLKLNFEKLYHITTQQKDQNKIPFTSKLSTTKNDIELDGVEMPTRENPIKNVEVWGNIIDNEISVKGIKDNNNENIKKIITQNYAIFAQYQVDFPKKEMQVGDNFIQKENYPIESDKIEISKSYTLMKVEDNIAYFDIEFVSFSQNLKDVLIDGKGKAEFSIDLGMFLKVETEINLSSGKNNSSIKNILYQKKLK